MRNITIVLINYNSIELIDQRLRGIEALSDNNLDVVVIDNSANFKLTKKYSFHICVQRPPHNIGFSAAANMAAAESDADIILFMNPDIDIDQTNLSKAIRISRENWLGWGSINCIEGGKGFQNVSFYPGIFYFIDKVCFGTVKKVLLTFNITRNLYIDGSFLFINRNEFINIGGFVDLFMYGEDMILSKTLQSNNLHFFYFPELSYHHTRSTSSGKVDIHKKYSRIYYAQLFFLKTIVKDRFKLKFWYFFLRMIYLFKMRPSYMYSTKENQISASIRLQSLHKLQAFVSSTDLDIEYYHERK